MGVKEALIGFYNSIQSVSSILISLLIAISLANTGNMIGALIFGGATYMATIGWALKVMEKLRRGTK